MHREMKIFTAIVVGALILTTACAATSIASTKEPVEFLEPMEVALVPTAQKPQPIIVEVEEIAPVQAPEGEEYTIKSGDTLTKIGIMYGFTADELAAYNGISDKNKIRAGKTIKIPPRNIQPMTASRAIEILQKVKDGTPGGLTVTEINEAFDMAIEKLKS